MSEGAERIGWATVIGAAAPAIRSEGIAKLDLDLLSEGLGVDAAAVRYWFQEPGEVLVALMRMRQKWFLEEARARLAPLPTHAERLRELLELAVADYDATFWIELWKLSLRDEVAKAARQEITDEYRRMIAGIIRAGQRTGEFGSTSPDKSALILTSLLAGFASQATLDDDVVTPDTMLAILIEVTEKLVGSLIPAAPKHHI